MAGLTLTKKVLEEKFINNGNELAPDFAGIGRFMGRILSSLRDMVSHIFDKP